MDRFWIAHGSLLINYREESILLLFKLFVSSSSGALDEHADSRCIRPNLLNGFVVPSRLRKQRPTLPGDLSSGLSSGDTSGERKKTKRTKRATRPNRGHCVAIRNNFDTLIHSN